MTSTLTAALPSVIQTIREDFRRKKRAQADAKVDEILRNIEHNPVKFAAASSLTDERTWLHFAAQHGGVKAVDKLLRAGSDVHARDLLERTPLHHAAFSIDLEGSTECMELLITSGGDPNLQDAMGYAPMHLACMRENLNCLKELVKKGANVDVVGPSGFTPLHILAQSETALALIQHLLQSGASSTVYDDMQRTPVDVARQRGAYKIMKVLHDAQRNRGQVKHLFSTEAVSIGQELASRKLETRHALPQLMLAMATGKSPLDGRSPWVGRDAAIVSRDGTLKAGVDQADFDELAEEQARKERMKPPGIDGTNELWENEDPGEDMTDAKWAKKEAAGAGWRAGDGSGGGDA
jgi:hypothetical protein